MIPNITPRFERCPIFAIAKVGDGGIYVKPCVSGANFNSTSHRKLRLGQAVQRTQSPDQVNGGQPYHLPAGK